MKKKRQRKTADAEPVPDVQAASDVQLVTVGLSRIVHRALRLMSVERGVPMSELIRNAVDAWLPQQAEAEAKLGDWETWQRGSESAKPTKRGKE